MNNALKAAGAIAVILCAFWLFLYYLGGGQYWPAALSGAACLGLYAGLYPDEPEDHDVN